MGDFLGNLVAKNMSLGELVMPRPVSIFEPTAKEGALPPVLPPPSLASEPEPPAPRAPVLEPFPIPRPQQPHAGLMVPDQSPAPLLPLAASSPVQPQPAPATPPSPGLLPAPVGESPIQPLVQPASPPLRKAPVGPSVPWPAAQELPGPEPAVPAPAQAPPISPPPPRPRQSPDPLRAAVTAVDANPVPSGPATPEPVIPSTDPAPVPKPPAAVIVRPQVAAIPPAEPSLPFSPLPEATAETPPAIQVTIGRIEVRATPPPAAPSQKQRPDKPAVMSLDEYLTERNGGGHS